MHEAASDPHSRLQDARRFRRALALAGGFVALLWWVHGVAWWFGRGLGALGVAPGELWGLLGVFSAPLIHGSWQHLIGNTLPLLVLGTLCLYAYPKASQRALPFIWLLAGLGTWVIGREHSAHIGASGLGHGLMFFLFTLGVLRWEPRSIAVALVTFLLYGGMLMTILPREPGVSWEAHLSGAVAGLIAALCWRRLDPAAPRRKYSWEIEEELARAAADSDASQYEPPRPDTVPVLWVRASPDSTPVVLRFPTERKPPAAGSPIDEEPPTSSRH